MSGSSMMAFGRGTASFAIGINASGQVVGTAGPGGNHAFLYSNGTMIDLTPGSQFDSRATSINASGQVVGSDSTGTFLYSGGNLTHPNIGSHIARLRGSTKGSSSAGWPPSMARPRSSSAFHSAPSSTARFEIHSQTRKTMTPASAP